MVGEHHEHSDHSRHVAVSFNKTFLKALLDNDFALEERKGKESGSLCFGIFLAIDYYHPLFQRDIEDTLMLYKSGEKTGAMSTTRQKRKF